LNKLAKVSGRNWKSRYFWLTPLALLYFVEEKSSKAGISAKQGEIQITGDSSVEEEEKVEGQGFSFRVTTPWESMKLAAATVADRSSWIKAINIAHKCSIKIYTDPCNYLSFLKQSLSGLISAGILPDNERVNQQSAIRRTVDSVEDTEELRMYNDLVILLGKYISRDLDLGKRCVEDVVKLWSSKSKVQ
jgi:hypothetical protein